MSDKVKTLINKINALEDELEQEFQQRREELNIKIENGRAIFDAKLERQHQELRVGLRKYVAGARRMIVLTAPFIYAVVIPFLLLDLFVTVYQAICFPVYGLQKVQRRDHIVFDRHRLRYLNALEKLNCTYCAYGNGLMSYVSEIAGRTESYWCPIKHARRLETAHRQYPRFAEFGDVEGYRALVKATRSNP